MGLFTLVINASILWATDQLFDDFELESIGCSDDRRCFDDPGPSTDKTVNQSVPSSSKNGAVSLGRPFSPHTALHQKHAKLYLF
ncbi:MAG: hypothetical protein CMP98_05360 [Gammaproteobacteria bacterium]|nr:hypothetical protein [Gammaproteobacteria bacterium]OUU10289.1 MAG: hypothetical protein CBB94_05520 [Gammaproteobacteria bacterium TMED34]